MFASGVGQQPVAVEAPNPRNVSAVDPNNPVIAEPSDISDSQAFMKLMIEQLKNQDPLNPLDSSEFTVQLAQINSLEQLITLNETMDRYFSTGRLAEATTLIGRAVEGFDANGVYVSGEVESVEMIEGEPLLHVGDQLLLLEQVVVVEAAEDGSSAGEETSQGGESA